MGKIMNLDNNLDSDDDLAPDGENNRRGKERVAALSPAELAQIDQAIMDFVVPFWRKQAAVIGRAMDKMGPNLAPDLFYATRIKDFEEKGVIESGGDLDRMRYSEIRLQKNNLSSRRGNKIRECGRPAQ